MPIIQLFVLRLVIAKAELIADAIESAMTGPFWVAFVSTLLAAAMALAVAVVSNSCLILSSRSLFLWVRPSWILTPVADLKILLHFGQVAPPAIMLAFEMDTSFSLSAGRKRDIARLVRLLCTLLLLYAYVCWLAWFWMFSSTSLTLGDWLVHGIWVLFAAETGILLANAHSQSM